MSLCFSLTLRVFSSAFSAKPSGSQNPMGGSAPGKSAEVNAFMEVGDEQEACWAGAKAAVEPMMVAMIADFMIIYNFLYNNLL